MLLEIMSNFVQFQEAKYYTKSQTSILSFQKNNLVNFRHNFGGEKQLRICQNHYILIQTKILNLKNASIFLNTFIVNVFAWVSGKIAQWDWHRWNSNTATDITLVGIQKCLCIKTVYVLIAKFSNIRSIETDQQWSI